MIKEAQALLTKAGYDPGPADGAMGPKTRSAIKQFQSKNGLASDGIASSLLLATLRKAPGEGKQTASAPAPAVAKVKNTSQKSRKTCKKITAD